MATSSATDTSDPRDAAPFDLLLGPTGTGKSEIGVAVAERLGADIVSLDSMLVYRGMDIGTAKPGAGLRSRVPHHLLDTVAPPERYDVSRYLWDAERARAAVLAAGRRVLFVGGTALYAKALLAGLFDGPPHDPAVRAALESRAQAVGSPALHTELRARDATSAARIHPNDTHRIVRALEVLELSGKPLHAWQSQWRDASGVEAPHRPHRLAVLERDFTDHEPRMVERARGMLAAGWVDEVRRIQAAGGFGPTSIQAIGYRDVLLHVEGHFGLDELLERIALATRQFARRQRTWLRRFETRFTADAAAADVVDVLERHFTTAPSMP